MHILLFQDILRKFLVGIEKWLRAILATNLGRLDGSYNHKDVTRCTWVPDLLLTVIQGHDENNARFHEIVAPSVSLYTCAVHWKFT